MARKQELTKEDMLSQALDDIKSKFGDGAIMRLGERAEVAVPVISSGILPLDVALGIGGFPRGRMVEIFGHEGTGKTTLALHAVAQAQKDGGTAAFIDAEHALDPRLAAALGVDVPSLLLSQPDSGEQALFILETLVRSGAVDVVVIDSVAALTPKAEIDGKDIGESQMGLQARLMSYALRRLASAISRSGSLVIFINQLRAKISTGYSSPGGPQETTTGGRALKFYTSLRLDVRRGKTLNRGDEAYGHELNIKVVKNKLAPPFRTAHTTLVYGKGIPNEMAVVDFAIQLKILKKKGSWIAFNGETLAQGKEKLVTLLEEKKELFDELLRQIQQKLQEENMLLLGPEEGTEEDEDLPKSPEEVDLLIEEGELNIDVDSGEEE
ncbi:MAG TPA: recombinase RecA [Synergistaceae bacterium]|nr:recombinase RecA [Synergistaceae bacterium]HPJ24786.1 recombinase RecA [Synergistaceae bacterium]HPQ37942.1 recombinase RecA [Synergistaceae bacterium]